MLFKDWVSHLAEETWLSWPFVGDSLELEATHLPASGQVFAQMLAFDPPTNPAGQCSQTRRR